MKKLNLLLLSLIIFAINGYCQLENYSLSGYKPPEYKFHSLNVQFDINGNSSFRNVSTETIDGDDLSVNSFGNIIDVDYQFYYNSDKYQTSFYASFATDYHYNKSNNGDKYSKGFRFDRDLDISGTHRNYFTSNKFYGVSYLLSSSLDNSRARDNQTTNIGSEVVGKDDESLSFRIKAELPISFGLGRIDDVRYAKQALFMLKEMQKQGYVKADLSDEEITKMADKIALLRNKRFFDSRLNQIYQIEQLDSFLKGNDLASTNKASYFATLYDQWQYGPNSTINNGKRLTFSLVPGLYYQSVRAESFGVKETKLELPLEYWLKGKVDYINSKPINLYWHREYGVTGSVGLYSRTKTDYFDDKYLIAGTSANCYYNVSYTPNTRTYFSAGPSVSYLQQFDFTENEKSLNNNKGYQIRSSLSGNANYYLSPKLIISGNMTVNYNYTKEDQYLNLYSLTNDRPYYTPSNYNDMYNWEKQNEFYINYSVKLTYKFM